MIALTIATATATASQRPSPAPPACVASSPNGLADANSAPRSLAPTSAASIGTPSSTSVATSASITVRAIRRGASCISSPKYTAAP